MTNDLPAIEAYINRQPDENLSEIEKRDMRSWSSLGGYEKFLEEFSHLNKQIIQRSDISDFLSNKNSYSRIEKKLEELLSDDPQLPMPERISREQKLGVLIEYLNHRNSVLQESRTKIKELKRGKEDLPSPIQETWDTTKNIFSSSIETYRNSDTKTRVILLAGAFASAMMLKTLWNMATKDAQGNKNVFGKAAEWGIGGVLSFSALGMINKTMERSSGKDLMGHFRGHWQNETQVEYDKRKQLDEIESAWKMLRGLNIPVEKFSDFLAQPDGNKKYGFAIANLTSIDIKTFKILYENGKSSGNKIELSNANYPKSPFSKDFLTVNERFALIKDVASDLELVDVNGNWADKYKDNEDLSLLYLALERV